MEQDKKVAEFEQVKALEQEKKFEEEMELEEEKELEIIIEELPIKNEMERAKKRRRELVFEMALFLVLGFLLGVTIKTEASKRITIGFNDYQINKSLPNYNVVELKKNLDEKIAKQQADQQAAVEQSQIQPQ
jgi:hypothetical protein